jgi:putative ABC transport system permease protein
VDPDARVFLFTVVVALMSGLGAGLAPARHGARGRLLTALQSQHGPHGGTAIPSRLRTSFVGCQAAVSMLLVTFAVLLARTAILMTRADLGFDPDHLLVVSFEPLRKGLDTPEFLQRVLAAVRTVPSVEHASVVEFEPFGSSRAVDRFIHDGRSYDVEISYSDAEFLSTAGVRLLRGRMFTADEVSRHEPVALISETIAREFFDKTDPIGQSLSRVPSIGGSQPAATIIGIAADALLDGPEGERYGAIYRPLRPQPSQAYTDRGFGVPSSVMVRTADPRAAAHAVEEAVRRAEPDVRPVTQLVRDRLETYLGLKRRLAWLLGPTAALALILAGLGLYGVTAFVLTQRTREVSIRLALGASSSDVWRLLVRDSLRPVVSGISIGLVLALALSGLLAHALMLSGISPHDPLSIGTAVSILLASVLLAVVIPARRAVTRDPAQVLRLG